MLLPNTWDVASAKIYEATGFSAIGTTNAGIAASLGYPDGEYIPKENLLEQTQRIVDSVNVPVTADIIGGYGPDLDDILDTVRSVIDIGVVGINIEDGLPGNRLEDLHLQVNKIRSIRRLANAMNVPLFINARTDVYWLNIGNNDDPLNEAIQRSNAYLEAGADCAFVPSVSDQDTIRKLATGICGPLNILAGPQSLDVSQLERLGVSRVSMGSGPIRAILAHVQKISEELYHYGTYASIQDQIPYAQVNQMFQKKIGLSHQRRPFLTLYLFSPEAWVGGSVIFSLLFNTLRRPNNEKITTMIPAVRKMVKTLVNSANDPAIEPLIGSAKKATMRVELITRPNRFLGTISWRRVNQLMANRVTEPMIIIRQITSPMTNDWEATNKICPNPIMMPEKIIILPLEN